MTNVTAAFDAKLDPEGAKIEAILGQFVAAGFMSQETMGKVVKLDKDREALLHGLADILIPHTLGLLARTKAKPEGPWEPVFPPELEEKLNAELRKYPDFAVLAPIPKTIVVATNATEVVGLKAFVDTLRDMVVDLGAIKARELAVSSLKERLTQRHGHRCSCGTAWEHSAAEEMAGCETDVEKEAAYEKAHTCPTCGTANVKDKTWVEGKDGAHIPIEAVVGFKEAVEEATK